MRVDGLHPMRLSRLFGNNGRATDIWAALCEARADGSDPAHQSGARYPLLVMVRSSEDELEGKVFSLLKTYGWQEPRVRQLRRSRSHSTATMRSCGIVTTGSCRGMAESPSIPIRFEDD